MNHRIFRSLFLFLALSLVVLACDASTLTSLFGGGDKPVVVIASPPSGSQFHEGEDVAVQSTSTDEKGVVRVELVVDNTVVDIDAAPAASGQSSFTLLQTWKATQGTHNVFVRAYNRTGIVSDPVGISVSVLPSVALAGSPTVVATNVPTATPGTSPGSSPTATLSPQPCTNNSNFVADVTVPDGTVFAANQSFNKIWRLSNPAGGCAWSTGYQFVFVSGSAMTASGSVAVPNTPAGGTADILVPMTAPAQAGNYSGLWRMKSPSGALFGTTVSVKISVPGSPAEPPANPPAPTGCSGTPNAFSFTASSTTITAGTSTTLQWDAVTNADSFEIDHGIGGQPAPGSTSVSPGSTTTYTATAHCGTNTKTAQVTITVNPGGPVTITRSSVGGSESGTVYEASAGLPVVQGTMLAGDISANKLARAFMSFDISDIAGKTINSASLDLTGCSVLNTPFAAALAGLSGIWVGEVQYGLPLDQSDYGISGAGVLLLNAKPASTIDVKSYVQTRVSQSKTRFQIRLHSNYATSNNNNKSDYFSCGSGVPKLNINYQP